jgi:transcriptional regulator with XRE-family HTH domain
MGRMGDLREARVLELAEQTKVHRATVWRWLSGRARPSPLAMARLAQLGVVLELPPPRRRKRRRR